MRITKTITTGGLAFFMAASPGFPVLATSHMMDRLQPESSLPTRMEAAREALENARERTSTTAQAVRGRLAEQGKRLIRAYFSRMLRRFDAALERERKMGERIESRIQKMREGGRDVVKAEDAIERAKVLWSGAKQELETVKGRLEGMLNSDDPRSSFMEIRSLLESVKEKIRGVHAAFVEAVTSLKGGNDTSSEAASSTP